VNPAPAPAVDASALPIAPLLPQVVASLAATPRLVLEAPPGAGKTTQVPLALRAAPWLTGKVLMLEPRRLAARAAAGFMARQLGEDVGRTVGYRIRHESRVSDATRIEVVTEAILTRLLQDDPGLAGVGAVVFDEFHERNLHADLGLAFALEVQDTLRPDLRLLVMSATLDGARLARHLDAPRLTSEGRAFPVEIAWMPPRGSEDWSTQLRRALADALATTDGDVLVFLPGKYEIARAARGLAAAPLQGGGAHLDVLELHGELSLQAQAAALSPAPAGVRRIVLATNVAESSVTLPGVRAVVDLGLAREPRFDPQSGLSRLETVAITQASATQRAGRAGRTAAGRCWRLWPESLRLEAAIRPELAQVELTPLALELAAWGGGELRWLDPPPPGPLAEARERLRMLDAIDAAGRISAHGRALLALGAHPRLAHMIVRAPRGATALACDLAALLEARDPLRGDARRSDDQRERVAALVRFRRERRAPADADRGALAAVEQAAAQLRRRARVRDDAPLPDDPHAAGEALALAFPERIARRDPARPRRYQLASGRGAELFEDSRLAGSAWLVAAELRADPRDSRVLRAAPVDEAFLRDAFAHRFTRDTEFAFDRDARAVLARECERFDAIVLSERSIAPPRDARAAALLAEGVRALGIDALPWTEPLRQWQARATDLRAWCPELSLPDLSDASLIAHLDDWLAPYLAGLTRLAQFDPAVLGEALSAQLDHAQRRALDEHAPVALTVPSGSTRRLDYRPGQPPVLAVKLQELFGLADTPRVARGRVPVTLHLLSPAQRPIQVTQDLRGFWERTYPEVRRELQARYPRHPWPTDPWNAVPTARAKRRDR
jgi:ATP-dependent helicase HrpB